MNEKGLRAARAVAQWHIGDPSWANLIVDAYLNPERAIEQLAREKGGEE